MGQLLPWIGSLSRDSTAWESWHRQPGLATLLLCYKARMARLRYLVRLGRQVWCRWRIDRCTQEAAALAYKTALSLVPLCVIAFSLLRAAGELSERSALFEFFATHLFPAKEARLAVQEALISFVDRAERGNFGSVGLAALLLIVFLVYHDIEMFWNRIWSAARRRSLVSSFAVFYLLATLVPLLIAFSLYHTARFWRGGRVGLLAPFASTFLALWAANHLLPSVRVKVRAAALGAFVSAVLYEIAKGGFTYYVMLVITKYKSIYGAFGLVPLLLVWIYIAWLTVLLGAEVAHAAQRLDSLEAAEVSGRRRIEDSDWELATGATAARLLVEISRAFTAGAKPPTPAQLGTGLHLPEEVVARLLERLRERHLVVELEGEAQGWLPARPPSHIRLDEVLIVFRPAIAEPAAERDRLNQLLGELDPAANERAKVTIDQLL